MERADQVGVTDGKAVALVQDGNVDFSEPSRAVASVPMIMKMQYFWNQNGVSLIAAIFIIVVLAFMGVIFVSMVSTSSFTAVNELQSGQALAVAEGGVEFVLENWAFPNYSMAGATRSLGLGTFTVSTPTYLTADPGAAGTTIAVQSTASFPNAGRITIDAEQINYTGKTANSFTGATRGAGGTAAASHAAGNAVYPVTTVTVDPGIAGTAVSVASTTGFAVPGVIRIGSEFLYCASAVPAQFTNCIRGYDGTAAAAHGAGTSVLQYIFTSTGVVGNAGRSVSVGVWGAVGGGIAFDAASSAAGNNVASLSWSHTAGGSQRILIVGVAIRNSGGRTVTGVTYNGLPLALIGAQNNGASVRVEQWYLTAPPAGAFTVQVNLSGNARVTAGSVSLTGVDQATPIDASAPASGSGGNPSVTVTTLTDRAWVVDALAHRLSPAVTAGAGQTAQWTNVTGGGPVNGVGGASSTEGPKTPAGAVAMTWTLAPGQDWALHAVALRPAAAAASLVQFQEVVQ